MGTVTALSCQALPEDFQSYFLYDKEVGQGCHSVVRFANRRQNVHFGWCENLPNTLALKLTDLTQLTDEMHRVVRNEIEVLSSLRTSYTVAFYGAYRYQNTLGLLMERAPGRELFEWATDSSLGLAMYYKIAHQLALAIKSIHDAGFAHRDIKPENVMLDIQSGRDVSLKIVDYGFACSALDQTEHSRTQLGTPGYKDPKLIVGDYNSMLAGDWWSYGQILAIILAGEVLYDFGKKRFRRLPVRATWTLPKDIGLIIYDLTDPDLPVPCRPKIDHVISVLHQHLHSCSP